MDFKMRWVCTASVLTASQCVLPAVQAEDSAELAKKALTPVAAMYSLPVQYNWDQKLGPTNEGMH
ncbi:MAG: transporter, partial [Pseudomonas sp.]